MRAAVPMIRSVTFAMVAAMTTRKAVVIGAVALTIAMVTIAAVGAVLLGHVGEAAALAFLFSLAEALEDRAMDRAKDGLRGLLALIPQTVRISRLGGDVTVPAAEVQVLDILVVGAGERVATDGVVVMGRSSIDTSVRPTRS